MLSVELQGSDLNGFATIERAEDGTLSLRCPNLSHPLNWWHFNSHAGVTCAAKPSTLCAFWRSEKHLFDHTSGKRDGISYLKGNCNMLHKPKLTIAVMQQVEARDTTCVLPGCHEHAHLHRFFIRRPTDRDYTCADIVMVCAEHLRGIKERKIGIAGDGDHPSITDATAALALE